MLKDESLKNLVFSIETKILSEPLKKVCSACMEPFSSGNKIEESLVIEGMLLIESISAKLNQTIQISFKDIIGEKDITEKSGTPSEGEIKENASD